MCFQTQQLLTYKDEDLTASDGGLPGNKHKNRYPDILPCELPVALV